jgi:protein-tyrosine phosphatase
VDRWFEALGGVTPIAVGLSRSPLPAAPEDFDAIRKHRIDVIYSLEAAVPGGLARRMGFDWRPHFWTDDVPPTMEQMDAFLDDLLSLREGTHALVHCRAGWGRTGSAVSCALIARDGLSADAALRHFWSRVPGSERIMRGNRQAEFVHAYAARRKGRGLP